MSEETQNVTTKPASKALTDSTGYVWRPEMPDREGCYKLKCDESKQQEFDVAITKAKDGSLYAESWMIGGEVPLVVLHRDLTNPQWAHLISVSHNIEVAGCEPVTSTKHNRANSHSAH